MLRSLSHNLTCGTQRPVFAGSSTTQWNGRRSNVSRPRLQRCVTSAAIEGAVQSQTATVEEDAPSARAEKRLAQLTLRLAASNIPHPDKASYGGEDAYFVSQVGGGAFGVADGVGGWADSGINPAEYSRQLMRSSTACIAQLDRATSQLISANLGDSGYAVFRQGRLVFRTPPLQHFFDCPYQFGSCPDFTTATDNASDAEVALVALQEGDVIVAGTDGLWDNVQEAEIQQWVPEPEADLQQAAEALAQLASTHSQDPNYESPYTQEALKQGFDLPWWEKVMNTKLDMGKFEIGKLELPSALPKFEIGKFELGKLPQLPSGLPKLDMKSLDMKLPEQMPKLQLGKLKGGKLDDITVVVVRVVKE
ncbi:hypothetical protein WJX72_006209 [[Myrmecia] bisecta]|uniref:Protein phosphatase n=1 Tax=[Myrmecia] bisecta TaxID=41462 RepID=A0AAW1Q435_9CHLO